MVGELLPLSGEVCARCAPGHPRAVRAVVFNRVPKCGSTTLEHIIQNASRTCGFQFKRSADFVNSSIAEGEQRSFVQLVSELSRRRRLVYDRHLHFVDFARFGAAPPQYINLVRDPITMQVAQLSSCPRHPRATACSPHPPARATPSCTPPPMPLSHTARSSHPRPRTPSQVSAFYFWRDCICKSHKSFCRSRDMGRVRHGWVASSDLQVGTVGAGRAPATLAPGMKLMRGKRVGLGPCRPSQTLPYATRHAARTQAPSHWACRESTSLHTISTLPSHHIHTSLHTFFPDLPAHLPPHLSSPGRRGSPTTPRHSVPSTSTRSTRWPSPRRWSE